MTLQPAAGAHGEWTALRMIQAFHRERGEERDQVIVPDSAHGTNPASAALAGFQVVEVKSNAEGRVDIEDLGVKSATRGGAQPTNPNTLGLFERDILHIAAMVHRVGGKLYYDGANRTRSWGSAGPETWGSTRST